MPPRRLMTPLAISVAAAVVVSGSFLPWLRSGTRTRNSFQTFAVVDRIGLSPDGAAGTAIRVWPFVPLLVVAAVVFAWWGWHVASITLAGTSGTYAGIVGVVVASAPARATVEVAFGPVVVAVGGWALVFSAGLGLFYRPPAAVS